MRMSTARACCLAAALHFGSAAAFAQDVVAGKAVATAWCSNCHNTGAAGAPSAREAPPTFRSIAQMKSTTEASLAAFLTTPHGRMPNLALSRAEIRDVSAYILSLRQ